MNISIPKERRPSEYRAGLTPTGVQLLTEDEHICLVENGTGLGAGFSDADYAGLLGHRSFTPVRRSMVAAMLS